MKYFAGVCRCMAGILFLLPVLAWAEVPAGEDSGTDSGSPKAEILASCPKKVRDCNLAGPVFFRFVENNGKGKSFWGVLARSKNKVLRYDKLMLDLNGDGVIDDKETWTLGILPGRWKVSTEINLEIMLHGALRKLTLSTTGDILRMRFDKYRFNGILRDTSGHNGLTDGLMRRLIANPSTQLKGKTPEDAMSFAVPDPSGCDFILACNDIRGFENKNKNSIGPSLFINSVPPEGMECCSLLITAVPKEYVIETELKYIFDDKTIIDKAILDKRC